MPMLPLNAAVTNVFWDADGWLPDRYEEPDIIDSAVSESLLEGCFFDHYIRVYGNPEVFKGDVEDGYYEPPWGLQVLKGSALDRLYAMLLSLFLFAGKDVNKKSKLVVITALSEDFKMISTLVSSLRKRDRNVIFALHDLREAHTYGITVLKEQNNCPDSIPVWLCPDLFDPGRNNAVVFCNFIKPTPPDPHTISFKMPPGYDTCVFWDLEDYPSPEGLELGVFCDNLKASILSCGKASPQRISIYLYSVQEQSCFSPFLPEGVTYVPCAPANKVARLAKMTMDCLLWSMDNPEHEDFEAPNLVLISKLLEDDILGIRLILRNLIDRAGYNVYLASPDVEVPPPEYYLVYRVPLLSWKLLSSPTGPPKSSRKRKIDDYYNKVV